MISLIVHKDRLELNNYTLKDHAISTLTRHPALENERYTLLWQFQNKQSFIYFLFPENVGLAVQILKEGHEGYRKQIDEILDVKRAQNVKLNVKESTPLKQVERVLSIDEIERLETTAARSNPKNAIHPFDRRKTKR